MKNRLQIRYHIPSSLPTREEAMSYIQEVFNPFKDGALTTLPAEPLVLLYNDEPINEEIGFDENQRLETSNAILAIGRGGDGINSSNNKNYFIIDFAKLEEDVNELKETVNSSLSDNAELNEIINNVRNDITELINSESKRAQNVETKIEESLTSEINRAKNQENIINNKLDEEINRLESTINNKFSELNGSNVSTNERVTAVDNKIKNEIERAKNSEKELSTKIDENIYNVNSNIESNVSELNRKIVNETDRATSSENTLSNSISNERRRAEQKESEIIISLTDEINRSISKDNELLTKINEENVRSLNAESNLYEKIEAEERRATLSEHNLTDVIENEINRAKNKENDLDDKIISEIERSQLSEKRLEEKIENEIRVSSNNYVELTNKIEKESYYSISKDKELDDKILNANDRISEEITRAVSQETALRNAISNENAERKSDIKILQERIERTVDSLNHEIVDRSNNDEKLDNKIDSLILNESIIRESTDNLLLEKIENNSLRINENKISSNGKTINVTGPSANGTNIDVNIDNNTIISNKGILSVNSRALTQYIGRNAIKISDDSAYKEISLKIKENDKIISNDSNGLYTTLSLKWVHADAESNNKDEIQLIGKNDIVISRIDVTDFIKDGILEDVSLDTSDKENPKLIFVFTSIDGKEIVELSVKDIIKLYHAGNGLELTESTFSIKIANGSEPYLTVSGEGLRLYGIQDGLDKVKTDINLSFKDYQDSISKTINNLIENINTLNITLTNTINELNNTKTELINTKKELSDAKNELKDFKSIAITDIVGATNEIKVTKTQNTATIGFADDAYFIAG